MKPDLLLAIDSGLTVTKAVAFDAHGKEIASGVAQVPVYHPQPHHVERNMDEIWRGVVTAVQSCLQGLDPARVAAVGVTAHGDGLYLVAENLKPAGRGILSLDSRSIELVDSWRRGGLFDDALSITGQWPHVSCPAALLAWLKRSDPQTYKNGRWVMACKDWIRLCLTGEVATDPTEASESFTDVETQAYSPEALRLYDLEDIENRLPPVIPCDARAGFVSAAAAAATGLAKGTPVATGLHDVTAAAIGLGNIHPGTLSVVAGTYCINETISRRPARLARSASRNSFRPGEWMNMSISPASSTNIDWALRQFYRMEYEHAANSGKSIFDLLEQEVTTAEADSEQVLFHPFLYGSPFSDRASATFFGVKGWHQRGHMLLAVLEGIAFNHRTHVDILKSLFPINSARATGGGTRNSTLMQRFAANLKLPVETVATDEVTALGVAICAGVACGTYADLDEGVGATVRPATRFVADEAATEQADAAYARYLRLADALKPLWADLPI